MVHYGDKQQNFLGFNIHLVHSTLEACDNYQVLTNHLFLNRYTNTQSYQVITKVTVINMKYQYLAYFLSGTGRRIMRYVQRLDVGNTCNKLGMHFLSLYGFYVSFL